MCSLGHRALKGFVKYPIPDMLAQVLGSHSSALRVLQALQGQGGAGVREIIYAAAGSQGGLALGSRLPEHASVPVGPPRKYAQLRQGDEVADGDGYRK